MSISANLSLIWGSHEDAYSGVIAQTLAISEAFRNYFFQKLTSHLESETEISPEILASIRTIVRDDIIPTSIVTEDPCGIYGRTDLRITFETMTLVIENKIRAGFQQEQLRRYDEYLRGLNENYLLVFLAPSGYRVADHEKPPGNGRFAQLSYKTLITWMDSYLKERDGLSELDRTYLCSVKDFLAEVDMTNIPSNQIKALGGYLDGYKAINALTAIVKRVNESIKNSHVRVEPSLGNYILGYKKIGQYPVYFGFRYGTNWYYAVPLIDNRCEAIVYVKDAEKDKSIALRLNEKLRQLLPTVKKAFNDCTVDYYDRRKDEECRLAIRKSLYSFDNVNIEQIQKWLHQTVETLETILRVE